MRSHAWLTLVLSFGLVGLLGCIKHKTGFCDQPSACDPGYTCDLHIMGCVLIDAGTGNDAPVDVASPVDAGVVDSRPDVMDARVAQSCANDAACPPTQNCNASKLECFSCTKNEDCTDKKAPACLTTGLCVACNENVPCASGGVCDTREGSASRYNCVGCIGNALPADAATASSSAGLCPADKPLCDDRPDAGTLNTCIECRDSRDCQANAMRPVCDTKTNTCVLCTKDSECTSRICLPEGQCADADKIIYVKVPSATACPEGDTKGKTDGGFLRTGTETEPYCAVDDAIADLSEAKNIIVLRGDGTSGWTNPLGRVRLMGYDFPVFILGRNNAFITAGAGQAAALEAKNTKLTVQSLQIRDAQYSAGVSVLGGALTMDRCLVTNNGKGGIRLESTVFKIQNTVIARNVGVKDSTTLYSELGIFTTPAATTPAATTSGWLINVSMIPRPEIDNAVSIAEEVKSQVNAVGVLIAAGADTFTVKDSDIMPICCSGTPAELGLAADYALTTSSPATCKGAVPTGRAAMADYYGTKRPSDAPTNCGAIETVSSSAPSK